MYYCAMKWESQGVYEPRRRKTLHQVHHRFRHTPALVVLTYCVFLRCCEGCWDFDYYFGGKKINRKFGGIIHFH